MLGKPFLFLKVNIWNASGNHYYVNGKRLDVKINDYLKYNSEGIREEIAKYEKDNTYEYFQKKYVLIHYGK